MGLLAIWVRRSELITHPGGLSHLRHYSGYRTSEHQGHELRSEAARNVNGSAVGRELRHPVECAAVDERNLDSFARTCSNLKPQAFVVVRMFEEGSVDDGVSEHRDDAVAERGAVFSLSARVMRRSGNAKPCCSS